MYDFVSDVYSINRTGDTSSNVDNPWLLSSALLHSLDSADDNNVSKKLQKINN